MVSFWCLGSIQNERETTCFEVLIPRILLHRLRKTRKSLIFLCAFAKFLKATVSFVTALRHSVYMPFCLHGTAGFRVDRLS